MGLKFETRFLLVLSFLCASQVCVTVYSKVATTTFERRYGLPSSISGSISIFYNVSAAFGLIFFSVYGSSLHRPKFLAIGGLLVSLGAFTATLPQFLSPPYDASGEASHGILCNAENPTCAESASKYFFFLLIGEIFMGLGFSGFMPLGMSYLHDSLTSPKQRGFYQGILLAIFVLGPLIAFAFIQPVASLLYVDFYRSDTIMDRDDPEWVGAWWIGYLFSGTFALLMSLPMLCFPQVPPCLNSVEFDGPKGPSAAAKMAKIVLTSSVPVILIVNHGILSITTAALNGFGMKYLERQFGLTAKEAGVQYGMITILGAVFGASFGGWAHRKFNLQERGTSWLILSCTIISVVSLTPLYYLGCETPDVIGLKIDHNNEGSLQAFPYCYNNFTKSCECPTAEIQLVQDENGNIFSSPCVAGCESISAPSNFSDCGCTMTRLMENEEDEPDYQTSWTSSIFRTCPDSILQKVLICFALSSFFHGIVGGPYVSLLLSRVPANTKVVTFGLMHLGMKIIGYAPGPFFAGSAIDSACIFWKTDGCGDKTSCQFYDNGLFRAGFTNLLVIPGLLTFPTYFFIV